MSAVGFTRETSVPSRLVGNGWVDSCSSGAEQGKAGYRGLQCQAGVVRERRLVERSDDRRRLRPGLDRGQKGDNAVVGRPAPLVGVAVALDQVPQGGDLDREAFVAPCRLPDQPEPSVQERLLLFPAQGARAERLERRERIKEQEAANC